MNPKKLSPIILFLLINISVAQNSITYNPETGNYDIIVNDEDTSYTAIYEPATKVDPTIKAFISINNDLYKYEYTVTNGITSRQRLLSIMIEYFSNFNNRTRPNNEWFMGKLYNLPALSWGHAFADPSGVWVPTTGIEQGATVSGFSFESDGLPTIVNSYFEGLVYYKLTSEPPPDIDAFLDSIRLFPNNSVLRKTVGPVDPPEVLDPSAFTNTLFLYCQQSFELGWITDQTTANKYTSHFQNAQGFIQQNNISEAINTLNTVLQEVQQDSGVTLSSEAYALLYYNTEYLIEQLKK